RERLGDIAAAAKAAVDDDRQSVADRGGDLPEHLDGRHAVIELPPAVVGKDDAVASGVGGTARVLDAEDAFDEQLPGPVPAYPGDIRPRDRGLEHLRNDGAAADRACGAGGQESLDVVESWDALVQQHLGEPARM